MLASFSNILYILVPLLISHQTQILLGLNEKNIISINGINHMRRNFFRTQSQPKS